MQILNQIRSKYRNFGIFKGVFLGSLIGFVVSMIFYGTGNEELIKLSFSSNCIKTTTASST